MNSTNRAANRAFILVCGLLLLLGGVTAATGTLVQDIQDRWKETAKQADNQVRAWLQQTPVGDTGVSWIMPAVLLLLIIGIVILIVFIARQGHGHITTAISETTSEHGTTIIDSAVAEHALQDALASQPEFITSHVTTYEVHHTPALKVSVTCRRGVSPKHAATIVETTLRALDRLLGRELPALIHISGGVQTRFAKTTRLH